MISSESQAIFTQQNNIIHINRYICDVIRVKQVEAIYC